MVVSLGAVLSPVSTRPGVQFLFENARAVGAVACLCLVGFGGVAVAASARADGPAAGRGWLRVGVTATVAVAFFAVQPLPAGADPTFKAYTLDDVVNPRYFFVCRGPAECAAYGTDGRSPSASGAEKTKVRVNGVVSAQVARLEYYRRPAARPGPSRCWTPYPGARTFSFRSANMAHGRLVAYDPDGQPIASYDDELAAALRATTR